jgi:hypothetical protein
MLTLSTCQKFGKHQSGIEEMKSILVCDLSYRVALDTAGPLPKTKNGIGMLWLP